MKVEGLLTGSQPHSQLQALNRMGSKCATRLRACKPGYTTYQILLIMNNFDSSQNTLSQNKPCAVSCLVKAHSAKLPSPAGLEPTAFTF